MKYLKKYWIPIFIILGFFMFYKPAVCLSIMGLILLYGGIHALFFLFEMKKNGIEILGEILSYKQDDEGYKTPIIQFETTNSEKVKGKPIIHSSVNLSNFKSHENHIDNQILVLYDPKNPEDFVIKENRSINYFTSILMALIGIGMLTLGVLHLLDIISFEFLQ